MAIGAIQGSGAVGGAAGAARYRRYDSPRGEAAGRRADSERVGSPPSAGDDDAALLTPAHMLASLIERMGGAAGSRVKGSFVNLRV